MPRDLLGLLVGFVVALQLSLALCERDSVGFVAVVVGAPVYVCVPIREGAEKGEPDRADVLFLLG